MTVHYAYCERSADSAHGEQNTGGPEKLQEPRQRFAVPSPGDCPSSPSSYLLNCAYCARLGVPKFHWFSSAPKSVPAFLGTDLGASIEFPVIPKRAQYAQFGCQFGESLIRVSELPEQ